MIETDSARDASFAGRPLDRDFAGEPHLGLAQQRRLADSRWPYVRQNLARNPCLDASIMPGLASDADPSVARALGGNPSLPPALRRWMLDYPRGEALQGLAGNPALEPAEQWELMAQGQVRVHLAGNPALLGELQEILAGQEDRRIRAALARNRSVRPDLLSRLVRDESAVVRGAAASNACIGHEDQRLLASDPAAVVRERLARNESLLGELQMGFALDERTVQAGLAGNRRVDAAVIELLATEYDDVVLQSLASNPVISPAIQQVLARRSAPARLALARNPSLDARVQGELAQAGVDVRRAVAQNPALEGRLQASLAQDRVPDVRASLALNPGLHRCALAPLLLELAGDDDRESPLRAAFRGQQRLGSATYWVPASLEHPVLGPIVAALTGKRSILDAARAHPDRLVRLGLATNPSAPGEAMQAMLADGDADVRGAAARRVLSVLAER